MPTCEEIRAAVGKYNTDNSVDDDALKSALGPIQGAPRSFGRILAEVCLVADWGTIQFFSFRDRVLTAREIEASLAILDPMRSLHDEDFNAETKLLSDAVDKLPSSLLTVPGKRQLSFLSKYLHTCVNDAFPIWDNNARNALGYDDDEKTWPSYKKWLLVVRSEVTVHKTCCLDDVASPAECLVRTLDKALYTIGAPKTSPLPASGSNRKP
jgi:hypothetical protein